MTVNSNFTTLDNDLKLKFWDIHELNRSDRTRFTVGAIGPEVASQIGIPWYDGVTCFQVLYLPWDLLYPTQIFTSAAGPEGLYYRMCFDGTWGSTQKVVTNRNFDGAGLLSQYDFSYIQAGTGSTRFRLQTDTNGTCLLFRSDDSGVNWYIVNDYNAKLGYHIYGGTANFYAGQDDSGGWLSYDMTDGRRTVLKFTSYGTLEVHKLDPTTGQWTCAWSA